MQRSTTDSTASATAARVQSASQRVRLGRSRRTRWEALCTLAAVALAVLSVVLLCIGGGCGGRYPTDPVPDAGPPECSALCFACTPDAGRALVCSPDGGACAA